MSIKDIEKLDTRSIEQKTYDEIKSMNSKIVGASIKTSGKSGGDLLSVTEKAAQHVVDQFGGVSTELAKLSEDQLENIGALQHNSLILREIMTVGTELLGTVPGVAAVIASISKTGFGQAAQAMIGGVLYPTSNAPVAEQEVVSRAGTEIPAEDALITFNPDDKFMMVAGTNVNGNADMAAAVSNGSGMTDAQINSLATAFAAAVVNGMRGVTITTDPLYSATSINGSRYA